MNFVYRIAAVLAALALCTAATAQDLRIGLASEPTSMDPHYHNLSPNNSLLSHVFESLVDQDEHQRLQPGLAESWKAIDDTTWEFKLRRGVKFHDGTPFTADDVLFSFERAPNVEGSPASFGIYARGKTLVKVDDHTVHFKTTAAYPLMPNDVSQIFIISRKHGTGARTPDYNSGKAAVGTGAFRYVEYTPGNRIILQRNDSYWGSKPQWARVVFRGIKSAPSRVAALLAGDADMIEQVPAIDMERLKKDPNIAIAQIVSNRIMYLHLDHFRDDSPFVKAKDGGALKNPLRDPRVRRAISKMIDRDTIVSRIMEGQGVPAGQLLPEQFFGTSKTLKPEKYDPEGAKKLLAEAGYPNGFGLTLHAPNNRYINDAQIAQAVAQYLSRNGIPTKLETMPSNVFFSRGSKLEFSFLLAGWGAETGETSSPLRALLASFDQKAGLGTANRGRFSDPGVDALLTQALTTIDDTKRGIMLARASDKAVGELMGLVPLHYEVSTWATRKDMAYKARADQYTFAFETRPAK